MLFRSVTVAAGFANTGAVTNSGTFGAASLTQTEAAQSVRSSLRGWQQWEAGDRAMPPGLFELFMLKTGQWPLNDNVNN